MHDIKTCRRDTEYCEYTRKNVKQSQSFITAAGQSPRSVKKINNNESSTLGINTEFVNWWLSN